MQVETFRGNLFAYHLATLSSNKVSTRVIIAKVTLNSLNLHNSQSAFTKAVK
jgi:hypothetical protein